MVRNASETVIGISERNPHYFRYHGKEVLLLTSAEHYGAMINKRFDYRRYFDALHAYGLNYTRIYPCVFVEEEGMFMRGNTLAPGKNLITCWARSDQPGYIGGGNKFDLSAWDDNYFTRLDDFMSYAASLDIIVEMCFFNCQSEKTFLYSPLHKDANIQGVGDCTHSAFQTLDNGRVLAEQLRFIEKLMIETNRFDNVIYEFIDEPTLYDVKSDAAYRWISALIDHAVEVESHLPKRHMLAQQLEYGVNFADDDRVSLIVTQYVDVTCRQVGGVPALNNVYWFNKPIEINETAFLPMWYECDKVAASRLEAWEFIVGGGAGFNQLNGYFTADEPTGDKPANHAILGGLRNLRTFMESMDFAAMKRDTRTVKAISRGGRVNGISQPGAQYAFYMHHSFPNIGGYGNTYYTPNTGDYAPVITLWLAAGAYIVTFINPSDLAVISKRRIVSDGAAMEMQCPRYELDIAFKITKLEEQQ